MNRMTDGRHAAQMTGRRPELDSAGLTSAQEAPPASQANGCGSAPAAGPALDALRQVLTEFVDVQRAAVAAQLDARAEPLLWNLARAAAALGISPRALKRAVAQGPLPAGIVASPGGRLLRVSRVASEDCVA